MTCSLVARDPATGELVVPPEGEALERVIDVRVDNHRDPRRLLRQAQALRRLRRTAADDRGRSALDVAADLVRRVDG